MDRAGEKFVRGPGTKYNTQIWTDLQGRYETEDTHGEGEFFFHKIRASVTTRLIYIGCKFRKE